MQEQASARPGPGAQFPSPVQNWLQALLEWRPAGHACLLDTKQLPIGRFSLGISAEEQMHIPSPGVGTRGLPQPAASSTERVNRKVGTLQNSEK